MPRTDTTPPRLERVDSGEEGVVVLELAGELDLAVSGRLRSLVDAVSAEQPRLVVVDVTGVAFMDSSVLREFLRAHREVNRTGGRLVVAGAQPAVRRLLELTGTSGLFALVGSRAEALSGGASPG